MLDETLLAEYCKGFFGYGNPKGTIWFVGLEEGGGRCKVEIENRLKLWNDKFERKKIIDCCEFHCELAGCDGVSKADLFRDPLRRQVTWDRLIRVELAFEAVGQINDAAVQQLRREDWGRTDSDNCLLELLPLPSPGLEEWPYERWTKRSSDFQTRQAYEDEFIEHRIDGLRKLIDDHKPKIVVFYGRRPRLWSQIAGFRWKTIDRLWYPKNENFTAQFHAYNGMEFVLMYHPGYWKMRSNEFDDYFTWVGQEIRRRATK